MTDLMPEMILFCGDCDAMGKFNAMAGQDPAVFIRIAATRSLALESQRFWGRDVDMLLSCNSIKTP